MTIDFLRDRESIRYRVLDHITMHPRCTTMEIAEATGLRHSQVKSACSWLQQLGFILNVSSAGNHRPRILVRREGR